MKLPKVIDNNLCEQQAHTQWENICRRCGRCCYEKIEYLGKIYLTNTPCEYLDLATNECTVYLQRCQKKQGCVALNEKIIAMGVLPGSCAYVQKIENYPAPFPWSDLPEEIRKSLIEEFS